MENIPPSYESATARNPWQIIAPYIPSTDLCALNRVSNGLHEVFAPYLWGNPASHFGTENDRVYVALTRFKRALKRVRLSVRELTHTLHLPPAQSEIYDGPHPEWLRDVLEQLPKLQSLVVSQLPFFDHMALLALRDQDSHRTTSVGRASRESPLRLLIATRCQNTTSQGLSEALQHFTHLAFLDLSDTLAARDKSVLAKLRNIELLQILKLRNIRLRDDDIEVLAEAIGIRVRSLDIQGNYLTDHSVKTLLASCFQPTSAASETSDGRSYSLSMPSMGDWPCGFVRPDATLLHEFRDGSYDTRLVRRLTSGTTSRLPYEDMPFSGITHLYIAGNNITIEGLRSLVQSEKLHVLDAGSPSGDIVLNRSEPASSNSASRSNNKKRHIGTPGIEKLTPFLAEYGRELTSLRVHHALLTEDTPPKVDEYLNKAELSAEAPPKPELAGVPKTPPVELDAAPPLYELEQNEAQPRFELPGDPLHIRVSPAVGTKPTLALEESQPEAKRAGAFAPEVAENDEYRSDETPMLSATGFVSDSTTADTAIADLGSTISVGHSPGPLNAPEAKSQNQLDYIQMTRQDIRRTRLGKPHGLIPGMMPKLRTLTLSGVPTHTKSAKVHQALIQFIKDCALESELATIQARLEPSPVRKLGERDSRQHDHKTREVFALRQLILEMVPGMQSSSPQGTKKSSFTRDTRSSTEDADTEILWSAAENDFTFFDDDEECGLPSVETSSYVPQSVLSEKMVMMPTTSQQDGTLSTLQKSPRQDTVFDVVHELAQFRKQRKAAYEAAKARGVEHVSGHWPGEVKIIRGQHDGGKFDYYGNRFEKTGVYR
ncbi:hypothetical protein ACLMJK_000155 [Lecanora helva]